MMKLTIPELPSGFRVAGVPCGLKSTPGAPDLGVIIADQPCIGAGVYTRNQVFAAPVEIDRSRTPSANIRGIVFNSGCANACTGDQGLRDAREMTEHFSKAVGCAGNSTLVMSTGIIGHHLDMYKVRRGIDLAVGTAGRTPEAIDGLSRALMTTDTYPKRISRQISLGGDTITITGFAKGAGMIGPNMATMLGVILTDAAIDLNAATVLLPKIADISFNCISVDGHTSTNDTLLMLASGGASRKVIRRGDVALAEFEDSLTDVATFLAKAIANDGEGAMHLIEIRVTGASSSQEARHFAAAIANSPLVKTAIAGCDPNWGRIVSAAGYSPGLLVVNQTSLRLNGFLLYANGEPCSFNAASVSQSMKDQRDVLVELCVGSGDGTATYWTCDLTAEYVRINADYHT